MNNTEKSSSKQQAGQNILGVMIRQWRAISGRALRDVAAEIGIGHTTLARIEKGETFDADTWLKMQTWLFKRRNGNEAIHNSQSIEGRERLPTGS